jgi:hypothetical protein
MVPRIVEFYMTQKVWNIAPSDLNTTIFQFVFANITSIPVGSFDFASAYAVNTTVSAVELIAAQNIIYNQITYRAGNFTATVAAAANSGKLFRTLKYYLSVFGTAGAMTEIRSLPAPVTSYKNISHTGVPSLPPTRSPTSAPSQFPPYQVVPVISKVTATAISKSTVTLSIVMKSSIDNPGTVYCNYLSNAPVDVGILKISPYFSAYSTVASTVSVSVGGLPPLATLTFYCMVQTAYGYSSSITNVLGNGTATATTSCCFAIAFSSAPPSVYGYAKKYSAGSTTNIFSYQLSNVPRATVTVTPLIYTTGRQRVTSGINTVPASLTFTTSSTGKLGGQFYLNSTQSFSGQYGVYLNVTGSGFKDYGTVVYTTVNVLSATAPAQPPKPLLCIFSNDGTYVTLSFHGPTDLGGITSTTWSCSKFLTFTGVYSAVCSWINSTTVKIVSSNIQIGDQVTILGLVLKAACSAGTDCSANYFAVQSFITVQSPYNPLTPAIVFKVPSKVSLKMNLVIDVSSTTGSGGRDWTSIYWFATSSSGDDDINGQLAEYLNDQSISQRIVVPKFLLANTYTITLTVTNFLGVSDTETVLVTVADDPCIATVSIKAASSLTYSVDSDVTIVGGASLPNGGLDCPDATLSYGWSVAYADGTAVGVTSTSVTPSKFFAARYSFTALYTYTITLTVSTVQSGAVVDSATGQVSLFVSAGAVVASIAGSKSVIRKVLFLVFVTSVACCRRNDGLGPGVARFHVRWKRLCGPESKVY